MNSTAPAVNEYNTGPVRPLPCDGPAREWVTAQAGPSSAQQQTGGTTTNVFSLGPRTAPIEHLDQSCLQV